MSGRTIAAALAAGLLLAGAGAPARAQNVPPDGDWRAFATPHFRVTYQARLEPLAREAGIVAEETYAVLSRDLTRPPRGKIDLVVADFIDYSNGFTTPFPSNRIVIYAHPAIGTPGLDWTRDWMEFVVAHEMVHAFHLDRTGTVGSALRTVFGRVPLLWPLFPAVGTPGWNTEGLATWYESRLTGAGRVFGSYHAMVVRTAAIEDRIPPLDYVSSPSPAWPAGSRSYIYGGQLMESIAEQYGPDAMRELIRATDDALLPTFVVFDPVARAALGTSFSTLYERWRQRATKDALDLAARLRAEGLTPTDTLVRRGPYAIDPRVSPDGARLAFSADDYRSDPSTRILSLATGRIRTLARRNQSGSILGPASWLPDGSGLIVSQLDFRGPYRAYSDLWRVDDDGDEHRLTWGARIASPDVAPDGHRIAAIQDHDGGLRLVIHDTETDTTRVLDAVAPGEAFDSPRWSPDGRVIAAARHDHGQTDVVVVDVTSGRITPITDEQAIDRAPTWTPDGRWILWCSDRGGISDIYAIRWNGDAPVGPVRRVTRVLTGAFDPEVSRDGRSLFLTVYHYDGWHIERMAVDTAAWTPAEPPILHYREGLLPPPPSAAGEPAPVRVPALPADTAPSRPYRPWRTLRPYYWLPTYYATSSTRGQSLNFFGIESQGWDVIQRDLWQATLARDFATGRWLGALGWTWRGLGNPTLSLGVSRDWSAEGILDLGPAGIETIYLREDRAALGALLVGQRWRRTAWLGTTVDIRGQEYQARDLDAAGLAAFGYQLRTLPTRAGLAISPGFSTARAFPLSISLQSGVNVSTSVGRWWLTDSGNVAYDEVRGRIAGYLPLHWGGYADHVLAARVAGLRRSGGQAIPVDVGGPSGIVGVVDLLDLNTAVGAFPVRGWRDDARNGIRAWAASVEYRFPLHMLNAPPAILGVSYSSLAGALFADAGDAWCPAGSNIQFCSAPSAPPITSIGAEIIANLGVLHGTPAQLHVGAAWPLGPDAPGPSLYLAIGPSF